MDFFVHHDLLDSPTQFYSSVPEIFNHSKLDQPFVEILFISSSFYCNFLSVSFSLGVGYSELICSYNKLLQYNVIMISFFPLEYMV